MPSNRSKKDVFEKDADKTLRRQLISPEFIKHIALVMTGKKAHNETDALRLTSSNREYMELEDLYNRKLASDIARYRREISKRVVNRDYSVSGREDTDGPEIVGSQSSKPERDTHTNNSLEEDKTKDRYKLIIPAHRFDDYWAERKALSHDLDKYRTMSRMYDGIEHRVVNSYYHSVMSILEHTYGSPLPVKKYNIEHHRILLSMYEKHRKEYNLEFPHFPEEYLVRKLIPDNE